jgi:hypothetical protein
MKSTDKQPARRARGEREKTGFLNEDGNSALPIRSMMSLEPLIRFWEQCAVEHREVHPAAIAAITEELKSAPELRGPIEDPDVLDRHCATVEKLMSIIFPPPFWNRDMTAALHPYIFESFYATPKFERFLLDEQNRLRKRTMSDPGMKVMGRGLAAYFQIARKLHGLNVGFSYPMILSSTDPDTGLDRHFTVTFDPTFMDVRHVGEPKVLSEAERSELMARLDDIETWKRIIPPESVEISGFALANAVDVTDQQELSALKRDLIESDSFATGERFAALQQRIRTLLRMPGVMLGITTKHGDEMLLLTDKREVNSSCIFTGSAHYKQEEFKGSIYSLALATGQTQVISDLTAIAAPSKAEEMMLAKGIRSVYTAPLRDQDQVIGLFYIVSPNPGELTSLNCMKLVDVLPLFATALKRSLEDLNNKVQRIIREEYTAIHPSVEWRFRRAALDYIDQQRLGVAPEPEPIIFKDVHPLFSVSDIRGSSTARNTAIQCDLIAQLRNARRVISTARARKPLVFLANLAHRIDRYVEIIDNGLGAGDESTILGFLQSDVEALFDHLAEFGEDVREAIEEYRSLIDPDHGNLYHRRREYEESVAMINRTIAGYVEEEQRKAQEMFPHYFEKHETDGVDISIYVGAELMEDRRYDNLYLRELRLWQLLLMCGIARRTAAIEPELPVALKTTHLVLVQHAPLSIRFRMDEKQFDVDGAYNIRYEIMKKRIDKATIKGSSERLTQPGMVAIVYSQGREAEEYREYIDFLRAEGHLTGEAEELELEELQGVQGLRALRMRVALDRPDIASVPGEIERAIRSMAEVGEERIADRG